MINKPLPRCVPEEVGISSRKIKAFIDEINRKKLGVQSFTVVRHGKIAAQCFWKPYDADIPHVMYSMSKSITSTAVGFAVDEGLLSVNDKLSKFFPEYNIKGENCELTVKHLLTMRSDKLITFLQKKGGTDWVKAFFDAPFLAKPDTKFNYISENTFMLSAIITKITGLTLVDYLYPRIFEPLGIEKPFFVTDGHNAAAGGWGCYMRSEDLAKFFLVYLNNGMYDGKRILSEKWVKEATSYHTATITDGAVDNLCGYGYQFWRNHVQNSYRADGLFGQRCFIFPEYDALVVMNCGEAEDYKVMDVFWKYFENIFANGKLAEDKISNQKLQAAISKCHVRELSAAPRNYELEKAVENKKIKFLTNEFTSVITVSITQMLYNKIGKISEMKFNFKDDLMLFTWRERNFENTIKVGMNGEYGVSEITLGDLNYTAYSKAAWQADGSLKLWIRPIQTAHVREFTFRFLPNGFVNVKNEMTPKFQDLTVYYLAFMGHPAPQNAKPLVRSAVKAFGLPLVEPNFIGKIE